MISPPSGSEEGTQKNVNWLLNSRATQHITNDESNVPENNSHFLGDDTIIISNSSSLIIKSHGYACINLPLLFLFFNFMICYMLLLCLTIWCLFINYLVIIMSLLNLILLLFLLNMSCHKEFWPRVKLLMTCTPWMELSFNILKVLMVMLSIVLIPCSLMLVLFPCLFLQ